ncbi:MAG: cation:proton antiporter [Burkholderiales bacterium]|nr:cation:proton antiporter [Burkholderiales bacterium]
MIKGLELALILLASAVLVVVLFRRLNLPPLLGYLLVGVAIGPHALAWVPDTPLAHNFAEFGIVFLMFTIGLEFSLPRLTQMRRLVFALGGMQVAATGLVLLGVLVAAGIAWQASFVIAAAFAMSSTAIVMRMLAERLELETPHGRAAVGVLLFQDLAVVPFLIVIPTLGYGGEALAGALALAALKALAVLAVLLYFGPRAMRLWFYVVAQRRSRELFIINVLFIALGLAFLTELAGLSLALGAFLAGMLISETEYRYQVEDDIRPFREVLLGLFFVSMGMQLDPRVVGDQPVTVALLFAVPMIVKFGVVAGLARFLGQTPGAALRTALSLAQAGEFGLVLASVGALAGALPANLYQAVVAGMLLSMLCAPFLIQHSDRLALRWSRSEWLLRSLELHQVAVQTLAREQHVIVCGYGRTGQHLARFLERESIPYVALDLDPDRVREAAAAGEEVVYGDASRREMLVAAGISRAVALVVSFLDTPAAIKTLARAHELSPSLPVIVRTRDDGDFERLSQAGAAEVVPDTFESSLMLASHAMLMAGIPVHRVFDRLRDIRTDRYRLLRGFYPGASDEPSDLDEAAQPRLHSIGLEQGAYGVGRNLAELDLAALGAEVTAVRRRGIRAEEPGPETRLKAGDVLVLLGRPDALAAAETRLMKG